MKSWKHLFERVTTKENFLKAFQKAKLGKQDHPSFVKFASDLDNNLEALRQAVINGTWRPWGYNTFLKYDGNKIRQIDYDPEFSDNLVQHAVAIILLPLFSKTAIRDTYSGIKGRGLHDGVQRVYAAIQSYGTNDPWVVKIDIYHFYQNVDIARLKQMLAKRIRDKQFLSLLFIILDSHQDGLPIGNYLSQHFANFFLNDMDHYMKEVIRCKHYFRYCDDIVILEQTKQAARDDLFIITQKLQELGLSLKDNKQVFPITRPGHLDFLGYVFFRNTIRIRRSIERDFRRAALSYIKTPNTHDAQSLISYYGWLKWTTSGYKLWNTLLPGVDDVKYHLPKDIDAMQNGTDLTDLVYDDGTILKHMVDVFNRDIIVVDYSTFINDRQERVLKIVFFFPDDEQPYRVFTQSKVLITVIPDIAKTKPFEPFKTRIIERNKCYTLAHTETI